MNALNDSKNSKLVDIAESTCPCGQVPLPAKKAAQLAKASRSHVWLCLCFVCISVYMHIVMIRIFPSLYLGHPAAFPDPDPDPDPDPNPNPNFNNAGISVGVSSRVLEFRWG